MSGAVDTGRWHAFLDARVADRGDAPAVSDSTGVRWTYSALDSACEAVRARLEAAGVRAGDRVLLLSENCAAAMAALFACSRMGAIVSPANARQSPSEIGRIIAHARPAAILFTTGASRDALTHAERLGGQPIDGAFGEMHLATPFNSNPDDLPDDPSGNGAGPDVTGSSGAAEAAVRYVGGMTDRFACRAGVRLLGWDVDRLPSGLDVAT